MEEADLTVIDEYRGICEELRFKPMQELERLLAVFPHKIDLSTFFFPPSYFESIILLVDRRCEIESLDISGVNVSEDHLVRLFSVLKNSYVKEMSLRNVPLNPRCGELLKKLVCECEDLVNIDLSGTMLCKSIESIICIRLEINRMRYENRLLCQQKAVEPDTQKMHWWDIESWMEDNPVTFKGISSVSQSSLSIWNVMRGAVERNLPFCDREFTPHVALKNPNVTWVRVGSLLQDSSKQNSCCVGGGALGYSVINDTKNLCAALNVVQQIHHLRKHLCVWRLPDLGLFAFRFCLKDISVIVIIDDLIPLVNNTPGGIHHVYDRDDYWGCLVEKAFAKLHGGYEKIAGVGFGYALSVLTGGVCFAINWRHLKKKFSETEMFRFLRGLINSKKILVSLCAPKDEIKKSSLEKNGICPSMSYVWTAAETFRKEESFFSNAVQLSCPNQVKMKDTVFILQSNFLQNSLLPRYWCGFEECLVHFEVTCALLWPQSDPLNNRKNVMEYSCNCTGETYYMSTFAVNPSFILTKSGNERSEVTLVLRCKEPYNNVSDDWIQIHLHKGSEGGAEAQRRYEICPRNELASTRKTYGDEVAILVYLEGGKGLQVTTSASRKCECTLTATSIHPFQLLPLPNQHVSTFKGIWNDDSSFAPSVSLLNNNKESIKKIVVSLSQEPIDKRKVGIGVEVWSNNNSCENRSLDDDKLLCTTETRTELIVVFPLELNIRPNEAFKIIPVMKKNKKVAFSMSIYSAFPLQMM